MLTYLVVLGVVAAASFVAGILVGRKNAKTVSVVVSGAKAVASDVNNTAKKL